MQMFKTRSDAAIHFTKNHGAAVGVYDFPWSHPVGAEIDKGADRSLHAHDVSDDLFAKTVLKRQHKAVIRQMRCERSAGLPSMLRLHTQENALPLPNNFTWCESFGTNSRSLHRRFYLKCPVRIAYRVRMIRLGIDKGDVHAF